MKFKINRVIIHLILSDIFILSAFGLISPIFAIFIREGISGGSILAAGIASSIFWVVKSLAQLPLSIYIDKRKEKLSLLLIGTFLIVIVPLIYAFSPHVNFIYFAQAIYALGAAMAYPAWFSLFTLHLDKRHRGFEWSLWSTGIGLGSAATAYFGAKLAEIIGFKILFFVVSGVSFIGMLILFHIGKKYLKAVEKVGYFLLPKFNNSKK